MTSSGHRPIRLPTWFANSAPTTLWSAPRPLPRSWMSAPRTRRSGRDTRVVMEPALAAVSTRCRSTVQVWMGSRGGRSRTAPHSGISLPHRPVRSSASMGAIMCGPVPSRTSRSERASAGHGSRSSGAKSASRASVDAAIGSPVRADAAATRKIRPGSLLGSALRARTTSPLCSTTPSSSGRRIGDRRSFESPLRGSELDDVRKPTSTA